ARLCEETDSELLETPRERHDRIGGQFAAHVEHEIDARSDHAAHRAYPRDGQLDRSTVDRALRDVANHAVRVIRDGMGQRIELQRGVAVVQHALRSSCEFVRRMSAERPAVGIDAYAVMAFAAEELVDRKTQGLALDVPQRLLDGADAGEYNRPTTLRPEAVVVHVAPHRFDTERILAQHDRFREVLDHAGRSR